MPLQFYKKYQIDISETFKLSLPLIFGRLGAVLMGVTDNIMVGKVGYESLAAAGISNSIFILVVIIAIGMMIVGSPLISQANSQEDKPLAVNILKSCIQIALIVSAIAAIILGVFAFNFGWFRQTNEVEALAVPYFSIILMSVFPLMFFIAVEQFSDGLEVTKISMFFNVSALCMNIALNWLLIYGNLGFPALGLTGAGIATLFSRVYMAIGIWCVVRYSSYFKDYDLKFEILKVHYDSFRKVLKQGIPSGMQFFFEVSAFSLAAVMVGWLGTVELAAHNVALSLASISYMISSGFATGGSIRVGFAYGQKNIKDILDAGRAAFIIVITFMALTCIIFSIFNYELAMLYNDDPKVLKMASGLLILAAFFQFGDGVQVIAVRALLGIQDIKVPTVITFISYWVVGIPLGCLLTFYFGLSAYGIWIGLTFGLSAAAIMLSYRFFDKSKRLRF